MFRSSLSVAVLLLAVTSSIATSGSDPSTTTDTDTDDGVDVGDVVTDPGTPDACTTQPIAPMTDVVCLAPGEQLVVGFGLAIDTSDLATIVSTASWVNGGALLDSVDAEVEITLDGPQGSMSEVLATEADFPIDENVVFVDDPMIGCAAVGSECTSTGWSFTIANVGDSPAVVHYQIQPLVANGAAVIDVFDF